MIHPSVILTIPSIAQINWSSITPVIWISFSFFFRFCSLYDIPPLPSMALSNNFIIFRQKYTSSQYMHILVPRNKDNHLLRKKLRSHLRNRPSMILLVGFFTTFKVTLVPSATSASDDPWSSDGVSSL